MSDDDPVDDLDLDGVDLDDDDDEFDQEVSKPREMVRFSRSAIFTITIRWGKPTQAHMTGMTILPRQHQS